MRFLIVGDCLLEMNPADTIAKSIHYTRGQIEIRDRQLSHNIIWCYDVTGVDNKHIPRIVKVDLQEK